MSSGQRHRNHAPQWFYAPRSVPQHHIEDVLLTPNHEAWMQQAACRHLLAGGDPWFPPPGAMGDEVAAALRVCATCPVRKPCADYATAHGERGIWGGTTANQRQKRAAQ